MKNFMITQDALDKLSEPFCAYGAIELIYELIKAYEERTQIIAAIQYGVENRQREENENPSSVLEKLRECYSADTAQEANDHAWLLRNLCELVEGANDVVKQYQRELCK